MLKKRLFSLVFSPMSIFSKVIIILIFVLAGVLFFHNLTSINVDIGRHIKLGEIIWQTGTVPKVNLFSFTASDYPFVNHHWLSEIVFYGVYSLGSNVEDAPLHWMAGLKAVMVLKVVVLLATYFLLFLTVRKRNIFAVALAFLVSIFVFSARTEPRPEIFSYLVFAAYLLIIYKIRESRNSKLKIRNSKFQLSWLWLLPILQLFWVNLHIYFIIGPILVFLFLIDRIINKKTNPKSEILNPKQSQNSNDQNSKRFGKFEFNILNLFRIYNLEFRIFVLVILANLANPNFIAGAIYPLTVLNNYGYSVAENSSLFFLAGYFGRWAPQDKLFLIALFVVAGSFIVNFWINKLTTSQVAPDLRSQLKARTFDLLLVAMTAILSFKMQRNIPLFALAVWPVTANNLAGITTYGLPRTIAFSELRGRRITNFVKKWLSVCIIIILTMSIYLVVSGRFYNWLDSPKMFGLNVSSAAQDGTEFIKANKIQGPVFNNFDIGSYLVWQLFPAPNCSADRHSEKGRVWCGTSPQQKVFVDGRPEAYPVEFFESVYKPMQRDEKIWQEMSKKYGINYIFFAHTDMTEWANDFLARMIEDKEWPMVFLNDAVVIFLKNTDANQPVIDEYQTTEQNMIEKLPQVLDKLDKKDGNAFINFGNILYRFRWLNASAKIYEILIVNQPNNPYGYQGAAYAYASMNDPATQEKAAHNLEKAIDLGFKTFNNYFTLGIIKANLGDLFVAEENIRKALEINPDHQNAKQALEVIKRKQGL